MSQSTLLIEWLVWTIDPSCEPHYWLKYMENTWLNWHTSHNGCRQRPGVFMLSRLTLAGRLLSQCRCLFLSHAVIISGLWLHMHRQLQFHQCSLSSLSPLTSSSSSSSLLPCPATPTTISTRSNTQHRVVLLPEYPGQVLQVCFFSLIAWFFLF